MGTAFVTHCSGHPLSSFPPAAACCPANERKSNPLRRLPRCRTALFPGTTRQHDPFAAVRAGFRSIDPGQRPHAVVHRRAPHVHPAEHPHRLPAGRPGAMPGSEGPLHRLRLRFQQDRHPAGRQLLADVFNFRKKRELQGWSFKAVFVFVNDVLVHKVSNGEPNIHRLEDKKNPLGPLQARESTSPTSSGDSPARMGESSPRSWATLIPRLQFGP